MLYSKEFVKTYEVQDFSFGYLITYNKRSNRFIACTKICLQSFNEPITQKASTNFNLYDRPILSNLFQSNKLESVYCTHIYVR